MPGEDSPYRTEHHGRIPPEQHEELGDNGGYQKRECRICGSELHDPLPNQYECLSCETSSDAQRAEIEAVEGEGPEDPEILPDSNVSGDSETETKSALQEDIENSDLPPLEMKPAHKETILSRIDGAGNEGKFRALHLEGDWERFYDEDKYAEPYETAVRGYLSIIAFYSRLSVLHMESFYRASALYDPDFWTGWTRLKLLEDAVQFQTERGDNYRIYGNERAFDERRALAQSRLELLERQINR